MKHIVLLAVFIIISKNSLCQTQGELTKISSELFKKAERELDTFYLNILKLYSRDTMFIKSIKTSQKYWQ